MKKYDIGLIGMGVMGQNLTLNINDHGFSVVVFNRTVNKTNDFLKGIAKKRTIIGAVSLKEFAGLLKKPRKIMLMIKSGKPVDITIDMLLPFLDKGDVIIDGGNSYFKDSIRRYAYLAQKGIHFIGAGISGGEFGARHGPSITPGGAEEAWEIVRPILQGIAAKIDGDAPCCEWMGADGSGHYVKMVHNAIEYSFMQLIAESFSFMKQILKLSYEQMAAYFTEWNKGKLSSFLIEITGEILAKKDIDGSPLVENILDTAGQKGTGRWTSESALELGVPLTLASEAVFARTLSARKDERRHANKHITGPKYSFTGNINETLQDIKNALYLAEIISFAQGFMLFREASAEYRWKLNYTSIANIWREGCIIRSSLLINIRNAYLKNPALKNLILDPFFLKTVEENIESLRRIATISIEAGVPIPAFSAALSFFDGFRSAVLPANLIQAQRDYFGSHTYERVDKPRGEFFHTDWSGKGEKITASNYNA
ncbi:MAG: decarboxylating NADP(+)-dependent phosphogluconate dehydrogenase [Anaerolineaceae bacterium]|nr:decarboxylating NADP(+)-dependent phosphogluconate dehydrogenase [Anaerolineaceae bacterium]